MTIHARLKPLAVACLAAVLLAASAALPAPASAGSGGGAAYKKLAPVKKATIRNGLAVAPAHAPKRVKRVIAAANKIIGKPYRYGGGHRAFKSGLDRGYDCSGTVSHALYGGRFLRTPMASGDLASWARRGRGRWITVYANSGHAYMVVAGLRLDTGMRDDPSATGPAWSKKRRSSRGYTARHPRRY